MKAAATNWSNKPPPTVHLKAGDYVEVRNAREIEATLDERGCLDGLPFMPEMAPYCGSVHRVFKRVDKIIDIVKHTGLRRMASTVSLHELRCDGAAHGGCQTGCQFIWKEAWLRRVTTPRGEIGTVAQVSQPIRLPTSRIGENLYRCQATELYEASDTLSRWDPRQYLAPLLSRSVSPTTWLKGISIGLFNAVQRRCGGDRYPHWTRNTQDKTPTVRLQLTPGEWVRVKSKPQIFETLDKHNRNRGLWFDQEMLRFCGKEFRVLRSVERLVEETSGKLITLKNPCIILDGVTASGELHRFSPQNDYIFWREIWLERIA